MPFNECFLINFPAGINAIAYYQVKLIEMAGHSVANATLLAGVNGTQTIIRCSSQTDIVSSCDLYAGNPDSSFHRRTFRQALDPYCGSFDAMFGSPHPGRCFHPQDIFAWGRS